MEALLSLSKEHIQQAASLLLRGGKERKGGGGTMNDIALRQEKLFPAL